MEGKDVNEGSFWKLKKVGTVTEAIMFPTSLVDNSVES